MEISVGKLGKMFGLSRTALLYYDTIGLLKPTGRSQSGYRLYDESNVEKLKKIIIYRDVGVPLDQIPALLYADDFDISALLFRRLNDLNQNIEAIKAQQDVIIRLLKNCHFNRYKKSLDRNDWIYMVKAAGIDESRLFDWHMQFENQSPEQHEKFLRMLEFSESEIKEMREKYRKRIITTSSS